MPLYIIKNKKATVFLKFFGIRHKNRTQIIISYRHIKNKVKKIKKTLAFWEIIC